MIRGGAEAASRHGVSQTTITGWTGGQVDSIQAVGIALGNTLDVA